jgi:hypothetical protein
VKRSGKNSVAARQIVYLSLTNSLTHSLTHRPTHSQTHFPTRPLTHPPTHSLAHPHPLTFSLTHPLTRESFPCPCLWWCPFPCAITLAGCHCSGRARAGRSVRREESNYSADSHYDQSGGTVSASGPRGPRMHAYTDIQSLNLSTVRPALDVVRSLNRPIHSLAHASLAPHARHPLWACPN